MAQNKLAESERRLHEQNQIMRADYESADEHKNVMILGRVPHHQRIEMGYLWEAMATVGGDIITFPRNPDRRLLFYLGDVCGHGVAAPSSLCW